MRILLPLFICAVIVGMAGSVALAWWGTGLIDRRDVAGLSAGDAEAETRRVNVLVVGDDSREGLTRGQIREVRPGRAEGNRTDSIMLVQLEVNGRGRAAALSFPRDLRVERCDGSVGRINAAYTVGMMQGGDGASCLVETVHKLTGVPIHHYVEVSFAGFIDIVDALGGVDLYLPEPIVDEKANLNLAAGCVTLSGADALGFVRARHVDNDFGRIARQQRFVRETLREASSLGVLANPPRLLALVDAAAGAVRTDDQLDVVEMKRLAQGMRAATADKLRVHTVPSVDRYVGSAWYVVELPRQAAQLYRSFRSGDVLDSKPQTSEVPAPPVDVLNADGRAGLAATAAEFLTARGVEVGEVGNADVEGLFRTQVRYAPELERPAARIAEMLRGADLVEGAPGDGIVVELGADVNASALRRRARVASTDEAQASAAPTPPSDGQASQTYVGASGQGVDC